MPAPRPRTWLALLTGWVILLSALLASAEERSTAEGPLDVKLAPPVPLPSELIGRPVTKLEIVTTGGRWQASEALHQNQLGKPLSSAYVRAIMREFVSTGRYADARAVALPWGAGALLRIHVLPRRIVTEVRVNGGGLDAALVLEAAAVGPGDDITALTLPQIDARVRELYQARGFPLATVGTQAIDTDEPMQVVLVVSVNPGDPLLVAERELEVHPKQTAELEKLTTGYAVEANDHMDAEALAQADLELSHQLQAAGYHEAAVEHRVVWGASGAHLVVVVWAGPKMRMRFEGNLSFDAEELGTVLEVDADAEKNSAALSRRVSAFYVARGFLDVSVDFQRREAPDGTSVDFVFQIREGARVVVRKRHFPCLTGSRSASDVAAEIDGVLSEALPGPGLFGSVDPNALDQRLAPQPTHSQQAVPLVLEPWSTYDPGAYEKALEHVRALYRSEGYLSAQVGPALVLRRACDLRSPGGMCVPVGPLLPPPAACHPVSANDAATAQKTSKLTCTPDRKRGLHCEPEVELQIPVVLGPRAQLWDIGFEGNRTLVESELHEATALELGGPVSQLALEEARRRIIERYAEEGYAFAGVEVDLQLSPDRTRARAKFVISERQPVIVRDVVVRGAHFTAPDLILSRAALKPGLLYRRSLVRATEERLATLGVFTSVSVDLEDPEVPARQKVAVIRVQERLPQYLDVRPGFSTGEGLRIAFEYGHRNLARRAIQFVLRVQLGYLPPPLILEPDVRRKFEKVLDRESLLFLLERRNSATLEFPDVGLGPLFRLGVEGLDLRDITRDFALEKRAAVVTLGYRPDRSLSLSLGASVELNEADVYIDGDTRASLGQLFAMQPTNRYLRNLLNIPDGLTLAISQRIGMTWDRRDNAVAATRGTLLNLNLEHVNASPVDSARNDAPAGTPAYKGHFLQYTGRVAGYVPLNARGMALAASFRFGFNQQLEKNSATYPDRLFFLGGVDSLRGFPLWSVVPEDLYRKQLPSSIGTVTEASALPIRGGDLLLNPRAELRIPVIGIWQTGIFLDTGNLWAESREVFNSFRLRYSAGLGLRVNTPVGPLALDYGVNVDRRPGEDFGAFHFSIGLF